MHRAFRKTPTGARQDTLQDTTVLTAARTAGAVAVCKDLEMINFSKEKSERWLDEFFTTLINSLFTY